MYDRIIDAKDREFSLIVQATGDVEAAEKMKRKRIADEMEFRAMNGLLK